MAQFKPNPSIEERGGLKAYMTELGYDYDLFYDLRGVIGDSYTAIAKALSNKAMLENKIGSDKPLRPQRVKEWCRVADREKESKKHA